MNLLILTCRRKGAADPWEYLKHTVDQIAFEEAPFDHAGVVVDGTYEGGPTLPEGWHVHEFDRTAPGPFRTTIRGNKWPYWHLLGIGADLGGDLIALEDDLLLCHSAVRRMMGMIVPKDLGWVQFFSPQVLPLAEAYPGLWRPPIGSSLFLQAARYQAWALPKLIAWRDDQRWNSYHESDTALAVASRCLAMRYGVHSPDLVQHAGVVSEATPEEKLDKWRTSYCWGGAGFDAMKLFQRDDLYR